MSDKDKEKEMEEIVIQKSGDLRSKVEAAAIISEQIEKFKLEEKCKVAEGIEKKTYKKVESQRHKNGELKKRSREHHESRRSPSRESRSRSIEHYQRRVRNRNRSRSRSRSHEFAHFQRSPSPVSPEIPPNPHCYIFKEDGVEKAVINIVVPAHILNKIIGRNGERICGIANQSGCTILFDESGNFFTLQKESQVSSAH